MVQVESAARLCAKYGMVTPGMPGDPPVLLASAFAVSRRHRVAFLHIGKTGGSTVHRLLREAGLDDGVLSAKGGSIAAKQRYFAEVVAEWGSYFKFTFVRNKFDQLVSLWHYDGRPTGSFAGFLHRVVAPCRGLYGPWIDQHFLTTIGGRPVFDFVGRFERFEHDLRAVLARLGITAPAIPRENAGRYDRSIPPRAYYDSELEQLVRAKFGAEIAHFGFAPEGRPTSR